MIVALLDSPTFKNDGEGYSAPQKAVEIKGAITPDLWQYNAVDDVDDAVGGIKIGGRDMGHATFGVGQHDFFAHQRRGQIAALDSGDNSLATAGLDRSQNVLGHQLARDDMIGQDRLKLRLVFWLQQGVDCTSRQLSKGGIRWCKYRERTLARQGVDEPGSLNGSNQRCVIGRTDGGADDIGNRSCNRWQCGDSQGGRGNGEQCSFERVAARKWLGGCHDLSFARRGMRYRRIDGQQVNIPVLPLVGPEGRRRLG